MSEEYDGIEIALEDYAQSLIPTSGELAWCRREANQLVRVLTTEGESASVRRVRIGGGLAKQTCVKGRLDVDLVVYVDSEPPFRKSFRTIQNLTYDNYRWSQGGNINISSDNARTFSFDVENRLEFNVYIAHNLVKKEETKLSSSAIETRQYKRSIQWLRQFTNEPFKMQLCSAFMAPSSTDFISEEVKDEDTFDLIRLCKKWNNTIVGLPRIRGRTSTIELLAATAMEQEQEKGDGTLLGGFRRFLLSWSAMESGLFCRRYAFSEKKDLFRPRDILSSIRDQRPLLIDPADPFNNKLKPFIEAKAIQSFASCAALTIRRLDAAEQRNSLVPERLFATQTVSVK